MRGICSQSSNAGTRRIYHANLKDLWATSVSKVPALTDAQVRHLLAAQKADGLKAKRGRAILSTLFHHALLRAKFWTLTVRANRPACIPWACVVRGSTQLVLRLFGSSSDPTIHGLLFVRQRRLRRPARLGEYVSSLNDLLRGG